MGSPSDPVTTDPKGEIAEDTPVYRCKYKAAIIRRPQTQLAYLGPYLSGYVDGEGCFTVSISKRPEMNTGWELRPSFSVSQNLDRAGVLYILEDYFKCGSIRPDRSDNTLKYEVRSLKYLTARIIPHFDKHPLLSEKQESFLAFRQVCMDMTQGKHLSAKTLCSMLNRATEINSGKRKYRFGKI